MTSVQTLLDLDTAGLADYDDEERELLARLGGRDERAGYSVAERAAIVRIADRFHDADLEALREAMHADPGKFGVSL